MVSNTIFGENNPFLESANQCNGGSSWCSTGCLIVKARVLAVAGKNSSYWLQSKSLYRSRAGRHFFGTENEIWAGFGPVANTKNKFGPIMEQLLRAVFLCF
jgi:hypothetical protein